MLPIRAHSPSDGSTCVPREPSVVELAAPDVEVGLARQLAERHVVTDPRQALAGHAAARDRVALDRTAAPAAVGGRDRVEVALHAVVAVDLGLAEPERPPEVVDVARGGARDPDVDLDQRRVGGDHHRDRKDSIRKSRRSARISANTCAIGARSSMKPPGGSQAPSPMFATASSTLHQVVTAARLPRY